MGHILLTGSTGLLGGYLLRDLLRRNRKVAVLVRPSRCETPEQRIEQAILPWEEQWQRSLPRPVVLKGEITEPRLGLDRDQYAWARRHCTSVLHSAASLTFHAKDDEPEHTNVGGTRNVLTFCHESEARELAYVSTAYVSGRRYGAVYESELDVGQELSNDYERSKLRAEQLVRSDTGLQAYTIFRPSIIVGDYYSGFTSTFHGFYSPLRIAHTLATTIHTEQLLEVDYLPLLGLKGDERKNFVPVDWVSEAIVTILSRRPAENQTYALVSQHPVTVNRLLSVFFEVVRRYTGVDAVGAKGAENLHQAAGSEEMDAFEQAYVEQFATYRTYWRDDPEFDCARTLSILGDRPCPIISDEVLLRLCAYAVEKRFGWPRRISALPEFCARDWVRSRPSYSGWASEPPAGGASRDGVDTPIDAVRILVTGAGGGCWTIRGRSGGEIVCQEGDAGAAAEIRMNWQTFQRLTAANLTLEQAVAEARVVVHGDPRGIRIMADFLDAARTGTTAAGRPLGTNGGDLPENQTILKLRR
jgi:thioester reductase-like protein